MPIRLLAFVLFMVSIVVAQAPVEPPNPAQSQRNATPPAQPAQVSPPASSSPDAELAQMRNDLNLMESMNNNMSSEIEFLRDQNLQILLRTNARMWTTLIRDLRQQLDREERRHPLQREPASPPVPR